MARDIGKVFFCLSVLALMLLAASQPPVQVHKAGRILGNGRIGGGTSTPAAGSQPVAFMVVDIRLSGEGAIFLSWSDLGSNFVYTVEFCDSLTAANWSVVPPV